jgi:RNA polymerase sigma-70 factor (ECF subfamily)
MQEPAKMELCAAAGELRSAGDLVSRARGGDWQAFEQLYRTHVGRIHAICRRMTGSPQRAEELTQETFVRAWQGLATFRGEEAFQPWLRRVAVNLVVGEWRRRRRWREQSADDLPEGPARSGQPGLSLDLEQAIAALPERARAVFLLHDVEGYGHDEVAALLEIASGTSKAQLHRARRLLREALR